MASIIGYMCCCGDFTVCFIQPLKIFSAVLCITFYDPKRAFVMLLLLLLLDMTVNCMFKLICILQARFFAQFPRMMKRFLLAWAWL